MRIRKTKPPLWVEQAQNRIAAKRWRARKKRVGPRVWPRQTPADSGADAPTFLAGRLTPQQKKKT